MGLKTAIPLLVFSVPVGQEFERSLLSGSALGSLTRAGGEAGKDGERDAGAAGDRLDLSLHVVSGLLGWPLLMGWSGLPHSMAALEQMVHRAAQSGSHRPNQ